MIIFFRFLLSVEMTTFLSCYIVRLHSVISSLTARTNGFYNLVLQYGHCKDLIDGNGRKILFLLSPSAAARGFYSDDVSLSDPKG